MKRKNLSLKNLKGNKIKVNLITKTILTTIGINLLNLSIPNIVFSNEVGNNVGENSISIGNNSHGLSANGVSLGKDSVATGGNIEKEQFQRQYEQVKDLVKQKQDKENELSEINKNKIENELKIELINKNIEEINNTISMDENLNNLWQNRETIKENLKNKKEQKEIVDNDVAEARKKLIDNNWLNQTIKNLNWTNYDGVNNNAKTIIATELKNKTEETFLNLKDKYNVSQYEVLINDFLTKQNNYIEEKDKGIEILEKYNLTNLTDDASKLNNNEYGLFNLSKKQSAYLKNNEIYEENFNSYSDRKRAYKIKGINSEDDVGFLPKTNYYYNGLDFVSSFLINFDKYNDPKNSLNMLTHNTIEGLKNNKGYYNLNGKTVYENFYSDLEKFENYYNSIDWNDTNSVYDLEHYKNFLDKIKINATKAKDFADKIGYLKELEKDPENNKSEIQKTIGEVLELQKTIKLIETFGSYTPIIKAERVKEEINLAKEQHDHITNAYEEYKSKFLKIYAEIDDEIVEKRKEYNLIVEEERKLNDEIRNIENELFFLSDVESDFIKKEKLEEELLLKNQEKETIAEQIKNKEEEIKEIIKELSKKENGINSQAYGKGAFSSGKNSIALGVDTVSIGDNSIGIGSLNEIRGEKSGAFGYYNIVNGNKSYAIGNNNIIGKDVLNTFVLGNNIQANVENSIVLGNESTIENPVKTSSIVIKDKTYHFAGEEPIGVLSIGADGKERTITHVAAGRINDSSTDAINGSQLFAIVESIKSLNSNIDSIANHTGNANNAINTIGSIKSENKNIIISKENNDIKIKLNDDIEINSIKLGDVSISQNGIDGGNKKITNIADGNINENSTDAINGKQLHNTLKEINNIKNVQVNHSYQIEQINNKFDKLNKKIDKNNKKANAGISSAIAMANMPQVMEKGKNAVSVAIGGYKNQNAVAIGYSKASDNGKHVIKMSVSTNSQKTIGYGAGYSYQW